ncbi:MAG: hypothetical protein NC341_10630 [Blautia sp.]|nr:hypothetical protein [Blautia sp.]MCM1202318.1 hypothetical protein [Bacteroides fragilis]
MDLGVSGIGSYLIDSNKSSTDALQNKLNSVSVKDASETQEAAEAELLDACKQFEAYLWEQVLKGMEKTAKMFDDDDEEEGYAGNMVNVFQDTFVQEMATQMTSEGQGANSLAQTLFEQMKRTYSAENY